MLNFYFASLCERVLTERVALVAQCAEVKIHLSQDPCLVIRMEPSFFFVVFVLCMFVDLFSSFLSRNWFFMLAIVFAFPFLVVGGE